MLGSYGYIVNLLIRNLHKDYCLYFQNLCNQIIKKYIFFFIFPKGCQILNRKDFDDFCDLTMCRASDGLRFSQIAYLNRNLNQLWKAKYLWSWVYLHKWLDVQNCLSWAQWKSKSTRRSNILANGTNHFMPGCNVEGQMSQVLNKVIFAT